MTTHHLSHDEVCSLLPLLLSTQASLTFLHQFFTHLKALLANQSSSLRGSVFLTQKSLPPTPPSESTTTKATSDAETTTTTTSFPPGQSPILIRASNGRHKTAKVKASTVVQPDELEAFYTKYAELCKAGMVGLKKRDRSGKKKGKPKGKVTK